MSMPDFSKWAKYLGNPMVLVGFVMMLLAWIIKDNKSFHLSEQGLQYFFYLAIGILIIGLVFVLFGRVQGGKGGAIKEGDKIKQASKGKQSPNVVSEGDVNISYGGSSSNKDEENK